MSDREPVSRDEFDSLKQQVRRYGCLVQVLLALVVISTLANHFPPLQKAIDDLFDAKYLVLGVGAALALLIVIANRMNNTTGGE